MDTNQQDELYPQENPENQPVSSDEHHDHKKGGIHSNALFAASMGRSATSQVNPHRERGLGQTGTNISYEGATSAGGGGSVGSGFTSGQSGVNTSLTTESDFDRVHKKNNPDQAGNISSRSDDAEDEMNEHP